MSTETLETIVTIVQPIFVLLLSYVAAQVAAWIKARVANTRYQVALNRLTEIVITTVHELEQTTVEGLKEASTDGKLSAEEKADLKRRALNVVLDHIGDLSKLAEDLGVTRDSIVTFIEAKIEAEVHRLRSGGIVL